MKRSISVLAVLCCLAVAVCAGADEPGELTDPIEILRRVDAASKAVAAVKYRGKLTGTEAAKSHIATVEGTVIMSGWANSAPQKYRCDVKVAQPGSSEVKHITIGSDGAAFFLIDHEAKKAYQGSRPAVLGPTGAMAVALWLREFLHETPFTEEIEGDKQELKAGITIGGEECYEIHVVYAGAIGEAVWWFSKRDFLPRGVQRFIRTPSGERAAQRWELTDVVVDPKLAKDTFKLVLPNGYTKTNEPAP